MRSRSLSGTSGLIDRYRSVVVYSLSWLGHVAHLGERRCRIPEAAGSSPAGSTEEGEEGIVSGPEHRRLSLWYTRCAFTRPDTFFGGPKRDRYQEDGMVGRTQSNNKEFREMVTLAQRILDATRKFRRAGKSAADLTDAEAVQITTAIARGH